MKIQTNKQTKAASGEHHFILYSRIPMQVYIDTHKTDSEIKKLKSSFGSLQQ